MPTSKDTTSTPTTPRGVDRLIHLMRQRPYDFKLSEGGHCLIHIPTGHEIWVSNGRSHYGMHEPVRLRFKFFDRWKFHRAYLDWFWTYRDEWLTEAMCQHHSTIKDKHNV